MEYIRNMTDKFGFGNEVRELKIGQSFINPKGVAFHAIKYDFKPASVAPNKVASVDVGNNHQVTVTVPHLDGCGTPQTVFKGSQKPFNKECVLIIDKITGEVTLEKLTSNIQLKKTRFESAKPYHPPERPEKKIGTNNTRSLTSPVGQRTSSKTKVTSGRRGAERNITQLVPKHSPLQSSPIYQSPKRDMLLHSENSGPGSLPMIGIDDFPETLPPSAPANPLVNNVQNRTERSPIFHQSDVENQVGEMSDSSSSTGSSSDSDSDNENAGVETTLTRSNTRHTNGISQKLTNNLLSEDLCLSETGSDSD